MKVTSSQHKVWQAAAILVQRHGTEAPAIANDASSKNADETAALVWAWIANAATELLRTKPNIGEKIH